MLHLLVNGMQLLVGRFQLLFRGLQFLVRTLQFFIPRLNLFIRRLQFLISAFLRLVGMRRVENEGSRRCGRPGRCQPVGRRTIFKNNQETVLILGGNFKGDDPDRDILALSVVLNTHIFSDGFEAFFPGLFYRALQLKQ